jgi:hypothetical protein
MLTLRSTGEVLVTVVKRRESDATGLVEREASRCDVEVEFGVIASDQCQFLNCIDVAR